MHHQPIAVFDSGLGGLTVVRSLRQRLPGESIIYFGDTARVPYGPKSAEVVTRFTREIIHFLLRFEPKCIVVACNTASAVALPKIENEFDVPVIGTIGPGAAAAIEAAGDGLIAILGTEATIASNQFRNIVQGLNPRLKVVQKACPLFVPLVEEGRDDRNIVVQAAVAEYLEPIRRLKPAVTVLGCTHYPLLRGAIADFLGEQITLIDTGDATAAALETLLRGTGALSEGEGRGRLLCYVSDDSQRFQALSARFLGQTIMDVVRVCPEEFYGEALPAEQALRVSA